ncbi:MAG: ROK family protein, partial [Bradymonadaceae bacterium]
MSDSTDEYHAGFDVGGTRARGALFDETWSERARVERGIRERREPGEVALAVAEMFGDLVESVPAEVGAVESVGVGLAAQMGADRRVVRNAPNLGWRDEPFADRLEEAIAGGPHVRLENDLNALLWGEYCAGSVEDVRDVLAVGAGGIAGEIGHSKVEPGGRLCGCGERGCVEAYAGGAALERRAEQRARQVGRDELVAPDDAATPDVDLGRVDELAAAGVEAFDDLWGAATDDLAVVVANACTLLDPSVLLLGGGVVEHCDEFRRRLLAKIPPITLEVVRD